MKVLSKACIRFLVFFNILFFSNFTANAQEEYEKWLNKQQESFQEFKDKRDKDFTDFLKQEWRKMQLFEGLKRDEKPKPIKMPVVDKLPPIDPKPPKIRIIKDIPLPEYVPPIELDLEDKPEPVDIERGKTLNLIFFDESLKVIYDEGLKASLGNQISKEGISAFWAALSHANYEDFLTQTLYFKNEMKLNDWGYGMLLNKIAANIYPLSQNERHLFVWFMLLKSGYEAKIGYKEHQIYLLLPSENIIYSVPYFNIEDKRYYIVAFDGKAVRVGTLFTYDGSYPGADKPLVLRIDSVPNFKNIATKKKLKFNYRGKNYNLSLKFNKNVINFFEYYPQTNLEIYFDAPISSDASYSLLSALKPIVKGKAETEAVNMLLRFVQTAFDYKTDQDQFGREKYLFAEETLSYPYSDCEDRSILFAYLVRNLLSLKVIGLDYPGHIATAVHFTNDIKGDYVMYKNKKYIICDPTYINANLGMRMPEVKKATPEVIRISLSMR